jgi:hypothetical protein
MWSAKRVSKAKGQALNAKLEALNAKRESSGSSINIRSSCASLDLEEALAQADGGGAGGGVRGIDLDENMLRLLGSLPQVSLSLSPSLPPSLLPVCL